jgi:cysteine synthase
MGGVVRAGVKAGIAKKVIDELRKPENQQRLKVIGARIVAEARKPENQERVRRAVRTVADRAGRRRPRPR